VAELADAADLKSADAAHKATAPSGLTTDADRAPATNYATDPDLARIVEAWGDLPDAVRTAMLAMVEAARGGSG
jgi:hypothetical protein